MDYAALKTELTTDPNGYGYATPYAGGDNGTLVALLNESRVGITVDVLEVAPQDAQACVVTSEYLALTDAARAAWGCIVGLPSIPVQNTSIRSQIAAIWGAPTTTRANLVALQTRQGSRAEQLFGAGAIVSHTDIQKARSS